MSDTSIQIILDADMPFIRHPDKPGCVEESRFFDSLSFTYLPLLRSCTALETEGIPFKLAIAFSPTLCEMMSDPLLQTRYIEYLDRTIEYGLSELERCSSDPALRELIKLNMDMMQLNRRDYVEIYDRNILGKFDYFATHGFIEILATTATSCFLPMFSDIPEAVNAQIETGLLTYRTHFTAIPSGFWLPAMAYTPGIEVVLKSYGFQYTVLETHGLLFASPAPDTGIFASATCKNGLSVFARDKNACLEVTDPSTGFARAPFCLDTERDIGFELDSETLAPLFDVNTGRRLTGFRYWSRHAGADGKRAVYEPAKAHEAVRAQALEFLDRRKETLEKASSLLEGEPVCITCAFPASYFGTEWYEGVAWLESIFRQAAVRSDISFSLPLANVRLRPAEKRIDPYHSSWFASGYAEEVLNSTNDWMYPYVRKATVRMIDLADRFPDDTGLKERSLNMAARELLLAQTLDWYTGMTRSEESEYAKARFEESLKAFTVVYESLGSNFISTEWLTTTEKKHNLFRDMNYRVFSHKK